MFDFKDRGFAAFAFIAAVVALSMTHPGTTSAQGNRPAAPVEIVAPVPLPVSGTVAVSGTQSVSVTNTPSVTISGNAAATPLYVRDVNNPPHQPVEINFDRSMGDGVSQTSCPINLYTVPADKQLVIEYVNLLGIGPSSPVESLLFTIESAPTYTFVTEQRGDTQTGSLLYTLSEPTRIYFGPGQTVSMCAARGSVKTGFVTARAKLSGYLVDIP